MTAADRTALVVDDHVEMARVVADTLRERRWTCEVVDGGKRAIEAIQARRYDLVVTDLRMAEADGLDVLDAARAADPTTPVVVMTAFGAIDSAIEAMRRGAWHYLTKPLRLDELVLHAERAFATGQLQRENVRLRRRAALGGELIGDSKVMQELRVLVERVAASPSPVLIRGESGSGKELVARALHAASEAGDRPFVAISCTALPEEILDAELFGGPDGKAGRRLLEEARGGTLFVDEIGDMTLALQAKLLRLVQGGEMEARLVVATHQDLARAVADGRFRPDLFYRLDVVRVTVPPLRERLDDIPALVEHFIARARARNPRSPVTSFVPAVVASLARYPWPGNVRELENLVERMVVVGQSSQIDLAELVALAPALVEGADRFSLPRNRLATLREVEEEYIAWVIERCGGNKKRAADVLGIDPSTLHRRRSRGGPVPAGGG